MSDDRFPISIAPMIAMAIAAIGIVTLLLVNHGPSSGPVIAAATNVLAASSAAERKAGVTVMPTVAPTSGSPYTAVPGP